MSIPCSKFKPSMWALAISAFGVTVTTFTALPSQLHAYSGEQYVVCKLNPNGDNFLALRQCGSSSCRMMAKLNPGTFIYTLNPRSERNWREVVVQRNIQDHTYKGPSGWVYDKYICRVQY